MRQDASSIQFAFNYTGSADIKKLKIAYISNYIDSLPANQYRETNPERFKGNGRQSDPDPFFRQSAWR